MAKAAAASKSKIDVVREILATGVTKTAEIVAKAKEMGCELSEGTAANYKHQLGKSKPRRRRGRPVGSTNRKKVARVVRSAPDVVSSDLELENLALRLIIKAGSVDKARGLIDKMA
jgi:hypothetical protein